MCYFNVYVLLSTDIIVSDKIVSYLITPMSYTVTLTDEYNIVHY